MRFCVLLLVAVVVGAIVFVTVRRQVRLVQKEASRQLAMSQLVQQAAVGGAPTGVLGAKWLMSMKEVAKLTPDVKPLSPGVLARPEKFYERPATVTYHFTNDLLLLAIVHFTGPSTPADFENVQARLAKEYGPMPRAQAAAPEQLVSMKMMHHIVIRHSLSGSGAAAAEQVQFYVRGGGDPKVMPKANVALGKQSP